MARKLRENEATFYPNRGKAGQWIIKVQRDGERKQFTSSKPGRKGKLEAERKADEWLEKGTVKELRFGEAYDNFIAAKKREAGTSWTTQLSTTGRLYLKPTLEHKKVSSITMQNWKDCILNAYEKGLSHKTLTNIRAAITNFHAYCEDAGIEIAPLRKLKVPDDAPTNEKTILQPADLQTLFSCDTLKWRGQNSKCWYINAWRLMVVLGLRRGELCGLQRDDVRDGKLYIRRAVNCYGEITKGKTKAAQRCVALPAHAQRILDDQAALLRAAGIVSLWLFPDGDGHMSSPNNVYNSWDTYRRQHGIKPTLHKLRHTYVSLMQDVIPETALKRMLGHTEKMDTFGTYGHEVDGVTEKAAKLAEGVLKDLI